MNNLKFRAYFEQYERMIDNIGIINQNMILVDFFNNNELEPIFITDKIYVMQSTGLFDKNGVEIFEGDIIRTYGNDYTPIYSKGIYMALNVSQIKLPKENWSFSTQFNIVWRDGGEVIGNIYENKELLGNDR